MRPIYFLFMVLLLGFSACRRSVEAPETPVTRVTVDQVEMREGVLRLKATGAPYSGVVTEVWPNGEPLREKSYQAGMMHGVSREWHLNGELKLEGHWQQGVQHGVHRERSEDGLEEFIMEFQEGKLIREEGSATEKLKAQIRTATQSREEMDRNTWGDEVKAQ